MRGAGACNSERGNGNNVATGRVFNGEGKRKVGGWSFQGRMCKATGKRKEVQLHVMT